VVCCQVLSFQCFVFLLPVITLVLYSSLCLAFDFPIRNLEFCCFGRFQNNKTLNTHLVAYTDANKTTDAARQLRGLIHGLKKKQGKRILTLVFNASLMKNWYCKVL
jgi:hypothetical protein